MAQYRAINQTVLVDRVILPGDLVADGVDPIARIQAAGGILYPLPNAVISAAAEIAIEHRKRGWVVRAADVMRSAMMSANASSAASALATLNSLTIDGWDDLAFGPITQSTGNAGLTEDTWLGGTAKFLYMRHDQADSFTVEAQIPHRANTADAIKPHFHFVPCAVGSGTFKLQGRYAVFRVGDTQPDYSVWTPWTAEIALTIASAADFKHRVLPLFSVTIANAGVSSMLAIFIERDTSGTYTANKAFGVTGQANIRLSSIDPHGRINRFGSATEYGP